MGCILLVVALAVPRVLMVAAYLLTDWFGRAFATPLWPILGFLFMPYTTLAYLATMLNNQHSVTGGWLIILLIAAVVDLGHLGGGGRSYRRRCD